MSLPTVIVAGTVNEPSGTSLVSGSHSVTFTTTAEIVDATGNVIVPKGRSVKGSVVAGLLKAADGTSAMTVYASDNGVSTVPYEVRESWRGGRQFTVNLLTTDVVSGHIAYSTLGPVSPAPTATAPYAFLSDVESRDAATLTAALASTAAEATRATTAEATLTTSLAGKALTTDLTTETVRATAAESALASSVTAEATARSNADAAEVIARNAAIAAAVAALVNGAPGALDTLKELADAINDDASFAASMTTALAGKQPTDADLTAIAALSTTAFGRAFLTMADAAATKTALSLVKGDVGLGSVDNTADASKPVSTAQATSIATKVPKPTVALTAGQLYGDDGAGNTIAVNPTGASELAYAENNSGTTQGAFAGGAGAQDITSCSIVVPASTRPVYLSALMAVSTSSGTLPLYPTMLITEVTNGVDTPITWNNGARAGYQTLTGVFVIVFTPRRLGATLRTRTFKLQFNTPGQGSWTVYNGASSAMPSFILAEAK